MKWARWKGFLPLCFCLIVLSFTGVSESLRPDVVAWLDAQTHMTTWTADFVQTRTLKSLTQPLTASGHVWFSRPNRFRWELGIPPQTIAVRDSDELLVIYPRVKTVERYPLNKTQTGPWRDALSLLEAGFPESRAELQAQYTIVSQTVSSVICQLALEPKSAAARRMIPRIEIAFATDDLSLRSTSLSFADGSTMRNEFLNSTLNPKIEPEIFRPVVPNNYKMVEPLKKR